MIDEPEAGMGSCTRHSLSVSSSHAATARKALSHERPDGAASASPAATLGHPSRMRESRPLDNRPTARPAAAPRGRQAAARRRDVSELDVEHNARSRAGQVSSHVGIVLPY
jgi:hypothetical protein